MTCNVQLIFRILIALEKEISNKNSSLYGINVVAFPTYLCNISTVVAPGRSFRLGFIIILFFIYLNLQTKLFQWAINKQFSISQYYYIIWQYSITFSLPKLITGRHHTILATPFPEQQKKNLKLSFNIICYCDVDQLL